MNIIKNKDIAAVIVTHNPGKEFVQVFDRIKNQTDHVIVVDNNSRNSLKVTLKAKKVTVIRNKRNYGIGKALNQGVSKASKAKYKWVLLLDQDTLVDKDVIRKMICVLNDCSLKKNIGILSSNSRSKLSGKLAIKSNNSKAKCFEIKTAITSGSLLSISSFKKTGCFREDYFIEGVDLEYCLRLRKNGFKVFSTTEPLMTHAAGKMREVNVFGRKILVTDHKPSRYYYMARNLKKIIYEYYYREPLWVIVALMNTGKMLTKVILFEKSKLKKFHNVFRGAFVAGE